MEALARQKCVACRGGDPSLAESEIAELLPQVPAWQVVVRDGIPHLERAFKFKNFVYALEFANKVGAIAEEEDHHPMLVVEWGRVAVHWWTHVVKGLHKNDFIMAAKTDKIFNSINV